MVSGIQVIGIIFGLVLSYFTFLHYKREEFTIREFWGWEILWIGFILITLYPNRIQVFAGNLGAIRPFDLFSVLGFIVVLSISYYTYVSLDRLRKSFEKAIRGIAMHESGHGRKK